MRTLLAPTVLGISLILLGCANQGATQSQPAPSTHTGPSTQARPSTSATPTPPSSGTSASSRSSAQSAPPTTSPAKRPALAGVAYQRGNKLPTQIATVWSVVLPVQAGGPLTTDFFALAREGGDTVLASAKLSRNVSAKLNEFVINDAIPVPAHDNTLVRSVCALPSTTDYKIFAIINPARGGGVFWAASRSDSGDIVTLARDAAPQLNCRWRAGSRSGKASLSWLPAK